MTVPSPYAALLAALPKQRSELTLRGSRTSYWTYGNPDAATTIVVVHGFRGDHHGLEPIIGQLGEYRLIAPDLPGFGESEPLAGRHDIDGYARWLRDFVAAVGTGAPALLGHSFGSIIVAAALAAGQPSGAVILINPIAAPALK